MILMSMAIAAACGSSSDGALAPAAPATAASSTTAVAPSAGALPIIIDTDVSLDDVMAILYLLRRPDVDVLAVTVNGNGVARCEAGVTIVLGLLAAAQQDSVPVACGAETPLEGGNSFPDPWRDARDAMATAGVLPLGAEPSPDSAATVIAASATVSSLPPTMVLLGTHTNLAQALREHPDLEAMLGAIHIMGGAIEVPGNTLDNPAAEWNLWIDPVADAEVFATDLPLSIVPLDATAFVPLTADLADLLAANLTTPEAEAALGLLRTDPEATTSGLFMWDQLAVVALVEPTVVTWTDLDVAVDPSTEPHLSGTLTYGAGRPARVALAADRSAFESEYLSTLTGRDIESAGGGPVSAARADYIAEADAVCAAANAEADLAYEVFADAPPDAPPTADLMGELWSRLEPILRTQITSLRDIAAPADDADVLDTLYDDFDSAVDAVTESVDAALRGDADALARLTGQTGDGDPLAEVNQRAADYGFQVCGAAQ